MIVSANTLKGWFITLAKPVQEQFWDWVDSFRHKSEPIALNDLTVELQNALQGIAAVNVFRPEEKVYSNDATFLMPAKYRLEHIAFKNGSGTDMSITVTVNGEGEALAAFDIAAGGTQDCDIGRTFWANTNINIEGIEDEITVLIDRK